MTQTPYRLSDPSELPLESGVDRQSFEICTHATSDRNRVQPVTRPFVLLTPKFENRLPPGIWNFIRSLKLADKLPSFCLQNNVTVPAAPLRIGFAATSNENCSRKLCGILVPCAKSRAYWHREGSCCWRFQWYQSRACLMESQSSRISASGGVHMYPKRDT